jgi:predicted nucleotidyltransferase
MSFLYDAMLDALVDEGQRDEDVIGVLLTGSLARGDALPGTDIDLRIILTDGLSRHSRHELQEGIPVERGYADEATARATLDTNPMHVYAYLDGRILYDPRGALSALRQQAQHRFDTYQVTEQEKSELATRLRYLYDKIRVAMSGGDLLKAAFVTGTSSWAIMEGLWAANNLPLPPNSSVRPHLRDLAGPPHMESLYRELFLADTERRVQVALSLYDWILAQLTQRSGNALPAHPRSASDPTSMSPQQ